MRIREYIGGKNPTGPGVNTLHGDKQRTTGRVRLISKHLIFFVMSRGTGNENARTDFQVTLVSTRMIFIQLHIGKAVRLVKNIRFVIKRIEYFRASSSISSCN
jgi:hypothetical protein